MSNDVKVVELMIGGGAVFALPDTDLEVMWPGPGSGLFLGHPRKAGGSITRIMHPTARETYDGLKQAKDALRAFVAAAG